MAIPTNQHKRLVNAVALSRAIINDNPNYTPSDISRALDPFITVIDDVNYVDWSALSEVTFNRIASAHDKAIDAIDKFNASVYQLNKPLRRHFPAPKSYAFAKAINKRRAANKRARKARRK